MRLFPLEDRGPEATSPSRRHRWLQKRVVGLLVLAAGATLTLGLVIHSTALTVAGLVEVLLAVLLVAGLLRSHIGERMARAVRGATGTRKHRAHP